ncbi:hypothetical protein [Coprococcus comes]
MKRTISGMIGTGSLAHNRRDFIAENVDPDRVQLNICYQNENLKDVYEGLFDEAVERYNVGKRKDRQMSIKTVSFFVVYVIHHKSDFLVI